MAAAMAKDRSMRRVDVAVAILVLQRSNQHTKVSIVPDNLLEEELGCNRAAFTQFRKRGAAAGYFTYISGRSGQATIYKWKNDRLLEIQNMFLDRRISKQEKSPEGDENEGSGDPVAHKKLSARAAASVKKPKRYGDPVANRKPSIGDEASAKKTSRYIDPSVLRKPSTEMDVSAEKTTHYGNAEKTERYTSQCEENLANSAKKTTHLHSYNTLRDSLPEEGIALTHTREAEDLSNDVGWTEDWQSRFDEIAAYLEYDQGLSRQEAEHQARLQCRFDGEKASSRQGAGTALSTVTKRYSGEGAPDADGRDDRDHDF
jgi:hypothetical protein